MKSGEVSLTYEQVVDKDITVTKVSFITGHESSALYIYGVIKQNQSEVGHIQCSVSYWIVTSICKATFCRKPH